MTRDIDRVRVRVTQTQTPGEMSRDIDRDRDRVRETQRQGHSDTEGNWQAGRQAGTETHRGTGRHACSQLARQPD